MPAIVYKNAAGKRVASVTTVLKQLGWSTDALMWWSWNEGIEGRNYRDSSGRSADVGTVVHAAIEADLKGEPFDVVALDGLDSEQQDSASRALDAWEAWKEQTRLEAVASEQSMVSERHQFGGTLDMCMIHKRRSILDIKTSKGLYPNVLMQIRAYGELWQEVHGEPVEDYYVLRLGKADASFHHHSWPADSPSMDAAWDGFRHCLALRKIERTLKGAV